MEIYDLALSDPKLNKLIDTLVELRNLHQELDDEHRDLSYKMGDFYNVDVDDDGMDLYYEYEDQQASLQDDMSRTEEDMKRLIAEYASLNQK